MAKGIKTGGKVKGSENKLTRVNRQFITDLVSNEGANISTALSEVFTTDKKGYLLLVLKLVDMCIPKLEPTKYTEDTEPKRPVVFELSKNNKITFNHE